MVGGLEADFLGLGSHGRVFLSELETCVNVYGDQDRVSNPSFLSRGTPTIVRMLSFAGSRIDPSWRSSLLRANSVRLVIESVRVRSLTAVFASCVIQHGSIRRRSLISPFQINQIIRIKVLKTWSLQRPFEYGAGRDLLAFAKGEITGR